MKMTRHLFRRDPEPIVTGICIVLFLGVLALIATGKL